MTLINDQAGGYGSGITWESKRSDANNIQTAGRISVQGYNSWNSDSTASSQMLFQLRHGNTLSDVLKIQNGNLVFPTQGKGIDFGATSSGNYAIQTGATASSTVLDDYEEGTWTPVVTAATGTTVHRAGYVKIGQLVFIQFYWNGTFATSGDPQYVTGLPYVAASVNNNYCALSLAYCDDANLNDCMPITNHNGSAFIYFHQNDGSGATLTRNDFNSRGCNNLIISGCYYANS
jgi:hypothetical protein